MLLYVYVLETGFGDSDNLAGCSPPEETDSPTLGSQWVLGALPVLVLYLRFTVERAEAQAHSSEVPCPMESSERYKRFALLSLDGGTSQWASVQTLFSHGPCSYIST